MNNANITRLIDLLVNMAMYNDKGFQWTGHRTAQIQEMRQGFRQSIDQFIEEVRPEHIPEPILALLRSPDILEDGHGAILSQISQLLKPV
ncbi:hypothetical protein [Chitinivorax sp. B]|uniref:hypothetical protein n=1 Tax=Chitinivorax sp. B TaxID=2502235 RepID=UPI0010F9665E|nr:hypothetical protein [Chitinivorax sp. B]